MIDKKRIAAYCLLAHINDSDRGIADLLHVFLPLIQKALSTLSNSGVSGGQLRDIKQCVDDLYGIDIPYGFLNSLLLHIANPQTEGTEGPLVLFKDGGFQLKNYAYYALDESMSSQARDIAMIEQRYMEFAEREGMHGENVPSLFEFVDVHRIELARFFSRKEAIEGDENFLVTALFVESVRNDDNLYCILRRIYLGSLISSYLELDFTEPTETDIELVLDTSFIIGLLDLSSEAAHHTCIKTLELAKKMGNKLTVLSITIEECKSLLSRQAEQVVYSPALSLLAPGSVEAACVRRKLRRTDLQHYSGALQNTLKQKYKCQIHQVTDRLIKNAEKSDVYRTVTARQHNPDGAIHDGIAAYYVQSQRRKPCSSFGETKCWFVTSHDPHCQSGLRRRNGGALFETIRAEYLLNILWLTNPAARLSDLSEVGLTQLVASTIEKALPAQAVIREFDENLQKYSPTEIMPTDVAMVVSSTAVRSAGRLEELNSLARNEPDKFRDQVVRIAKEQQEKQQKELAERSSVERQLRDTMDGDRKVAAEQLAEVMRQLEASKASELHTLHASIERIEAVTERLKKKTKRMLIGARVAIFVAWGAFTWGVVQIVKKFGWDRIEPVVWIVSLSVSFLAVLVPLPFFSRRIDVFQTWSRVEGKLLSWQMARNGVCDSELQSLRQRQLELEEELSGMGS